MADILHTVNRGELLHAGQYWYNEEPYRRVSTIISNASNMPQFKHSHLAKHLSSKKNWDAATLTREGASDAYEFEKYLRNLGDLKSERAMRLGSDIHDAIEGLILDKSFTIENELVEKRVAQWVNFMERMKPTVVASELVVFNHNHRYAGTLDLILDIQNEEKGVDGRFLVDVKTGSSGVWGSMALQLAAYLEADDYVLNGDSPGTTRVGMLPLDGAYILHLGATQWKLVPMYLKGAYDTFAKMCKVAEWFIEDEQRVVLPAVATGRAE